MNAVLEHLRDNYRWYVLALVCVLPPFIIFRRRTAPLFLYAIELAIYAVILHVVLHGVVYFAAWFKDQSTMKRARGLLDQDYSPGWKTPLLEFWKAKLYDPHWLLFLEIALLVAIVLLMWRFRPLQMGRSRDKKKSAAKKKPARGYDYRKQK